MVLIISHSRNECFFLGELAFSALAIRAKYTFLCEGLQAISRSRAKRCILCAVLSISHALTGAFIASKLSNPGLYIPLTLASHYLEDWIPHWDVGTGLSNGTRRRSTAILLELGELSVTIGLVWWFATNASAGFSWHILVGAFVGLLPDFLEAPRNFLKWEPFFFKPFNDLHGMFHHSTPHMLLGLTPQVAVVLAVWLWR
jgi:hypothetical protein